ncbi:hypothetical protein FACS189427_00960 [Planctomycetales bacterium]|nr:hypothetical protein FACS189427_00960 [Planctomycetales bacterium]
MSVIPQPLTYEQMMEMFRQTDLKFQDTDRKFQDTDRKFQETREQMKRTDRRIAALGGRIGDIVQAMVEGNILDKFQKLGYGFDICARNVKFQNNKLDIKGEIDLFLEDGDVALLIEVKSKLETADVREHIKRMEKFRCYADAKKENRTFIAAVAGAVVDDTAEEFAHKNGMYVIVQSGDSVKIVKPPKNFKVKEW